MKSATLRTRPGRRLRDIKSAIKRKEGSLMQLADAAWNFAYSVLWSSQHFSTKEVEKVKNAIATFLQLHADPEKGFSVFCQRTIIAMTECTEPLVGNMPLPSEWFDWNNDDGFISTKVLFDDIQMTRASLPLYRQDLKALAEAILEFSQEPTKDNYAFWQHYFIERNQRSALSIFRLGVVQQIFPQS